MSYRPKPQAQFRPSTSTSGRDCVAASTALLIDRATVGAIHTDHAVIRKRSGAPATRGLYNSEATKAAATFGVTLTPYSGLSRNALRDLVASGRACGVSISCAVTRNTSRRTNSYTGPHRITAVAYSWWDKGTVCNCNRQTKDEHGEFTVEDPGTTSVGYQQWSAVLVYRAAEAHDRTGKISVLAAPDTEGRSWKAVMPGKVRKSPRTDAPALADIQTGKTYPGGRTDNGGDWVRKDGTEGDGWIHVRLGSGAWGWIRGEAAA